MAGNDNSTEGAPRGSWLKRLFGGGASQEAPAAEPPQSSASTPVAEKGASASGTLRNEYALVDYRKYGDFDLNFYESSRAALEEKSFRYLGDLERIDSKGSTGKAGTLIRVMVNEDGTVTAWFWQPVLMSAMKSFKIFLGGEVEKIIDFETEFSTGAFLSTCNATADRGVELPPEVQREWGSENASVRNLLEKHLSRVWMQIDPDKGVIPRKHFTLGEVLGSRKRQDLLLERFAKRK